MEKYKEKEKVKWLCFIFMLLVILLLFIHYPKRVFAATSIDESYITALEINDIKDGTAPSAIDRAPPYYETHLCGCKHTRF